MIYHAENDDDLQTILSDTPTAGSIIYLYSTVYRHRITTYLTPTFGGYSWSNKITIRAWPGQAPVLRPDPCDFVILITQSTNYVEFQGIDIDAINTTNTAVKLTYSGNNPFSSCHHIRFKNCKIHNATNGHGILATGQGPTYHEILNNDIHGNGNKDHGNKDHGMYITTANNLIEDNDVSANAAYGICLYSGIGSGVDNNTIRHNHVYDHSLRSGILISSGTRNKTYRNVCLRNQYGIHVLDSQNATLEGDLLEDNREGPIYISPDSTGTVVK